MNTAQPECLVCAFNEINHTTALLIRKSQQLASMQNLPLRLLWAINDKMFSFEHLDLPELKAEERVQREFSLFAEKHGFSDIGNCDIRFGKPFVEIIRYQNAVNAKFSAQTAAPVQFGTRSAPNCAPAAVWARTLAPTAF